MNSITKTVDILYTSYYDFENEKLKIGGVQTYITNLIKVIKGLGWRVRVFQQDNSYHKCAPEENLEIISVDLSNAGRKKYKKLLEYAIATRIPDQQYLTLFGSDNIIPKLYHEGSIAIQHGIFWDVPSKKTKPLWIGVLSKFVNAVLVLRRIQNIERLVCVDYNFINWYRAHIPNSAVLLFAIPNFTDIPVLSEKNDNEINIIFARRLFDYRGTRIFAYAAEKLLCRYSNIKITVAGTGPDEKYMRQSLEKYPNVVFTEYRSEESLKIHSSQHIAVVPSIGSEGTSLSLLEAMATGCAVVCTNIGGMTNIILDGYNGLMVSPDGDALYSAISELIEDEKLRRRIADNGRDTAVQSFSFEKWKQKWETILLN